MIVGSEVAQVVKEVCDRVVGWWLEQEGWSGIPQIDEGVVRTKTQLSYKISRAELGVVIAVVNIAAAVLSPVVGRITDRIGGKAAIEPLAAALDDGADADALSSPGRPALYLAASRGDAEAARLLIDAGADVHADTFDGALLVVAAVEGQQEIVQMLPSKEYWFECLRVLPKKK